MGFIIGKVPVILHSVCELPPIGRHARLGADTFYQIYVGRQGITEGELLDVLQSCEQTSGPQMSASGVRWAMRSRLANS
jgi:hypothetical protein